MLGYPAICTVQHASTALKRAHANYRRLLGLACECHANGRSPDALRGHDLDLARLYCHAFRRQVIGVFHATRVLLEQLPVPSGEGALHRLRAREILAELANLSIDPVPRDFRVLLGTFYRYEQALNRAAEALQADARASGDPAVAKIEGRFCEVVDAVRACNGIELTRDTEAPLQASFVVPNLGITIVPLVYGDYHSWNLAWLDGRRSDVPFHRHFHGVEIHLGYSPMRGHIVLDRWRALTDQGYALPIPPSIRHGYVNASDRVHHLPFIFGSYKRGGWGVFFDVEPQPIDLDALKEVPFSSHLLNSPVAIEREILNMTRLHVPLRQCILPASRTNRDGTGGLELHLTRAPQGKPVTLSCERFLAASVVQGRGVVRMAGQERAIEHHDHFAIPAGVPAIVEQVGEERLVLMDADLKP